LIFVCFCYMLLAREFAKDRLLRLLSDTKAKSRTWAKTDPVNHQAPKLRITCRCSFVFGNKWLPKPKDRALAQGAFPRMRPLCASTKIWETARPSPIPLHFFPNGHFLHL
jgi:hypothetical protein